MAQRSWVTVEFSIFASRLIARDARDVKNSRRHWPRSARSGRCPDQTSCERRWLIPLARARGFRRPRSGRQSAPWRPPVRAYRAGVDRRSGRQKAPRWPTCGVVNAFGKDLRGRVRRRRQYSFFGERARGSLSPATTIRRPVARCAAPAPPGPIPVGLLLSRSSPSGGRWRRPSPFWRLKIGERP